MKRCREKGASTIMHQLFVALAVIKENYIMIKVSTTVYYNNYYIITTNFNRGFCKHKRYNRINHELATQTSARFG